MSRNALIIGINTYHHLQSLTSPAEDAEAIARLLEQYGKFHVTRLHAVKDDTNPSGKMSRKKPVSQSQLESALLNLFNPDGRNVPDTALFFFSGHGLRRDRQVYHEGYLAVSDADNKERWGISFEWLRRLLEASPVKQQIIWLDCCHAGELLNFEDTDPGSRGHVRDRFFIAASREYEAAYEETSGKHGLLTAALLEALDPVKQNGDVTNHSVGAHISTHLRSTIQQPVFSNFGGVIELTHAPVVQAPVPEIHEQKAVGECPYKGLEYFDFRGTDPDHFFGREALTDQLLDAVRKGNFLAVLGPSGSGKSSVVRAGLIHQLKTDHRLSGSGAWPVVAFKPISKERIEGGGEFSDDPLDNLAWEFVDSEASDAERGAQLNSAKTLVRQGADGLADLIRVKAGDGRVVMLIDQFEEVFTLCGDMDKREAFLWCILGCLPVLEKRICLILTMRADFLGKCAEGEYAGLPELIQENLITVTPMNEDDIRRAIVKPAEKTGLEVQDELIKQMITDVKHSPGSLPLLQYVLTELWREREGNQLTVTAYTRMGGVKGALARRADEIYEDELSSEEQAVAKRIFIALTHLGEGSEDTRRQVTKKSLVRSAESEPVVDDVIQKLAEARLIVTNEVQAKGKENERVPVVDVAHEALIRHWGRLRQWLDEDRDAIRFERRLDAAIDHWIENDRHENLLWRSPDLDLLEEFSDKRKDDISPAQKDFLEISAEARSKARKKKNLIICLTVIVSLIFAALGWKYAVDQKKHADAQKSLTEKAENLLAKNYWSNAINAKKRKEQLTNLHCMTLCARTAKNKQMINNCFFEIYNTIKHDLAFQLSQKSHYAIFSNDETRILTLSDGGIAQLWNKNTGELIGQPMKHHAVIRWGKFNRDDSRILIMYGDSTVRLWNGRTGENIKQFMRNELISDRQAKIYGAVFGKDGSRILTWDKSGTACIWSSKTGELIGKPIEHEDSIWGGSFSKDGVRICTWSGDGSAHLWNGETGKHIRQFVGHELAIEDVIYNKAENRFITISLDGTARLWNSESGQPIGTPMKHKKSIIGAVFSNDDTRILTWSSDGTVRLWNGANGRPIEQPMEHKERVFGALFSNNGKRILTWIYGVSHATGEAYLWNGETCKLIGKPMKHEGKVYSALFSQNGSHIITWGEDGTARLWDAETSLPTCKPLKHDGPVNGAIFNNDQNKILTWSEDKSARLWNVQNGNQIGQPLIHNEPVGRAMFSKNEKQVLTWSAHGISLLWDIENEPTTEQIMEHNGSVLGATFSKDENRILTWSIDDTAILWNVKADVPTGQIMKHSDTVRGAAFSTNENRILTWSADGMAHLWDGKNITPISGPIKHNNDNHKPLFNKNISRILTWNGDCWGIIDEVPKLWKIGNNKIVEKTMEHDENIIRAILSNSEDRILTWSIDDSLYLWDAITGKQIWKQNSNVNISLSSFYDTLFKFNRDDSQILIWGDSVAMLLDGKTGRPIGQAMDIVNKAPIWDAIFSKNNKILIWSFDNEGTISLWDSIANQQIGKIMRHGDQLNGVKISQNNKYILSWSENGTIRLWNTETGISVDPSMKHDDWVTGAAFNNQETCILTWSKDGTARLWDVETKKMIGRPMKHESSVNGAVFSKDETQILTWSSDGTVRLWNGENCDPVGQIMKHDGEVNGAMFNKDETRILTWSKDGTARLWEIGADYDFPKQHLPLLVEVATGTQMDDYGNVTTLSKKDWEAKRDQYIKIAEEHLKTCKYRKYNLYEKQRRFWWPVINKLIESPLPLNEV